MASQIHRFEQCCWDVRGFLSTFGPDEACCEGLTPRQCRVLRAIGSDSDINLSDLAEREGLTPSGMSRRVDPLVEGGYLVRRKGAPTDGRELRLMLTPKGRIALESVENTIYGSIEKLWRAVPPAERPKVLDALTTLVRAARVLDQNEEPVPVPVRLRTSATRKGGPT
ncbi:MAG: MarR family winged helix-turn-helix transcriptional regulator [Candidatus Eiseniibacteriota bacterium]